MGVDDIRRRCRRISEIRATRCRKSLIRAGPPVGSGCAEASASAPTACSGSAAPARPVRRLPGRPLAGGRMRRLVFTHQTSVVHPARTRPLLFARRAVRCQVVHLPAACGGVAERSKALVLKTREGRPSQGSNPCPSATPRATLSKCPGLRVAISGCPQGAEVTPSRLESVAHKVQHSPTGLLQGFSDDHDNKYTSFSSS